MYIDKLPLKKWRQLRGLTQQQLADATGLNINTISSFEQGGGALERSSYNTLSALADALDIEVDNIFLNPTWIKSK